jgi:preprotein translocase subunit SecA
VERVLAVANVGDDIPIESKMVTRAIRSAQTQVETQNFEVRKDVLKYDEVLNRQRTVIYDERRKVLEGADLHVQIQSMLDDVVGAYVDGATETGYAEDWDLEQLWTGLKALYPVALDRKALLAQHADGEQAALSAEVLKRELLADAHRAYDEREASLGEEVMRELERRVLLSVLDRKWREHLYEMDYLRAGIHLRAMANRDPIVEYQREGFDMFNAMLDGIKEESVGFLFNLEVQSQDEQAAAAQAQQEAAEAAALAAAQEGTARVLARQAAEAEAAATANAAGNGHAAANGKASTVATGRRTAPELNVKGLAEERRASTEGLTYSAPTLDASAKDAGAAKAAKTATVSGTKQPSRNAPCPCGSGKKYKFCHGAAG